MPFIREQKTTDADALLAAYTAAPTDADADAVLARLFEEHAAPVVARVVRRKLRGPGPHASDAEDLRGQVMLQLLTRLAELRADPRARPIQNFGGYAAAAAYRACADYLRALYPQRHSLRNKLRYFLTHQTGFALWETAEGEWLCGRRGRQDAPRGGGDTGGTAHGARYQELREDARRAAERALPGADPQAAGMERLLPALFDYVGEPVELDDLVGALAEVWNLKEQKQAEPSREGDEGVAAVELLAAPQRDLADELSQRMYLARLWQELLELPVRQRAALLLNLRDAQGASAVELFVITGVASPRDIAGAVGLGAEEFAALWTGLPLEDRAVAELLGATRQQVINLRKCARERLARRMRAGGF
jgi:DNA-directed RNA polymerase specialized sigma24 family protein